MVREEEQKTKLQKRNPEIIEDASFYQDLTYVTLMKQIDKYAKDGKSRMSISKSTLGEKMKVYLEKKGFKISEENVGYSTYTYLEW
jgi:hypothetical protein